ncbi:hypothetical protein MXD81_16130, partial [Microbacteriaceae bacterium K1510]|nr:hypothetical protein [Microbacteriaceae bacterium K1510]
MQEATEQFAKAEEKLQQMRGELAVDAIEASYLRLEELDKRSARLRSVRAEAEAEHKKHVAHYEATREKRTQSTFRQAALQERMQERKQKWEEKHLLWKERTNGEPAGKKLSETDALHARLRKEAEEAEQLRNKAMEARQQAHELLVKTEETYTQVNRQRSEAELSFQRAMMEAEFERPEQLEQLYLERERLHGYQERVNSFTT